MTSVTWNGITYSIPASGETGWASLSDFLIALGNGAAVSEEMKQSLNVVAGASYTVSSTTDWAVYLTNAAARAVTLPAGSGNQVFLLVDGSDAVTGNITITPNGAETIGGSATKVLDKTAAWVMIQYHVASTDWKIIAQGAGIGQFVTLTGSETLSNKKLVDATTEIVDSVDPTKKIKFDASGTAGTSTTIAANQGSDVTLTLPAITDVLVSRSSGDITGNRLSNKHFEDATFAISDTADNTQLLKFDVQGSGGDVTTIVTNSSTNRSLTVPDADGTFGLVPSTPGPVKSSGTALTSGNINLASEVTGTLPVANGGTGVTTSTGTTSVVLSNSPTLVTPDIGTPSAATLTNATGLPLSTGVTGTLPIGNGGTGQTTANAALNALLPTQATNANKFLQTDATNATWQVPSLSDLSDADPTGAEDGQALVFSDGVNKFIPGASGDSSFKLQSILTNDLILKGGYLKLADGRELATYDGSTYGAQISVTLTTLQPTMGTSTWYLYIDIDTLGSEVSLSGSGRKVYAITQSNMILSTTKPESISRARYIPLGTVLGATPNYSNTNFTTYAAKTHNNGPLAVNPKVYSLSQAVGSVGSASQIKAGHLLTSESFPSAMAASKVSFFNLAADALDDSANARNLTNNGSTAFTGTNIFGGASLAANLDGTDDNFSSTNAHFNPGNGKSWATGGWFKATDWTPAATDFLISNLGTTSDRGLGIAVLSDGSLQFLATNTAAAWDGAIPVVPGFTDGSWHHVSMVYDFSTTTLKAYIDGKLVGSTILANTRSVTSSIFRVGAEQTTPASFFTGAVEDCFFVNDYLLTDADIRKLYASKLTHGANVSAANQDWKFLLGSGVQKVPSISPVVDQTDSNTLYADFSDLDAAETVDIALLDMGMTAVAVPAVPPFDQTYTSNPSFPISHGLSEVPSLQVGYKDASNDWHWTTGEGAVRADSTQLKGSLQTYFDAAATEVRLRAVVGASPTGVKEATSSAAGIVKGGTVPGKIDGVAVAAGYVGEFFQSKFSTASASGVTAGQYGNLSSIALSAGVWMLTGSVSGTRVSGQTYLRAAISENSSNITTDHTDGYNQLHTDIQWDHTDKGSVTISGVLVNNSTSKTYYIKGLQDGGTWTQANWQGHITAIRIA